MFNWMNPLEYIMLSERSQAPKGCAVWFHLYGILEKPDHKDKKTDRGLTFKGTQGTFWDDGNVLYLDMTTQWYTCYPKLVELYIKNGEFYCI